MANFAEEILYGDVPTDVSLVDEPNLLVQSLEKSAERERKEYKNAKGNIYGLKYINPLLTLAFTAQISTLAGLANAHPGLVVGALDNWTEDTFGFLPADGVTIYEDPSVSLTNDGELPEVTFNAVNFPFVDHTIATPATDTITGEAPVNPS